MRNNNINDEEFGKEISDPNEQQDASTPVYVFGIVVAACLISIVVCLTIRADRWLLH